MGSLSDVLVGRTFRKNTGLGAFATFLTKDLYEAWKEEAAEAVWINWLDLVKKGKKVFGANSFFILSKGGFRG